MVDTPDLCMHFSGLLHGYGERFTPENGERYTGFFMCGIPEVFPAMSVRFQSACFERETMSKS
jgi:hypothetical protein